MITAITTRQASTSAANAATAMTGPLAGPGGLRGKVTMEG
jgi:hypothetical protein